MKVDIEIKKIPPSSEIEPENYEALVYANDEAVMGAIGDNVANAMKSLHKKMKTTRRWLLLALPLLEFKMGFSKYSVKIDTKKS